LGDARATASTRGRADAKAKGVRFGRKPKLTAHQQREARERIEAKLGEPLQIILFADG
jgi:hypothetical protein